MFWAIRKTGSKAFIFAAALLFTRGLTAANPAFFPAGWGPHPRDRQDYREIADSEGAYSGNSCAFFKGHLIKTDRIPVSAGDEIEVSFYAKDPAGENISVVLYTFFLDRMTEGIRWGGQMAGFTGSVGSEWTSVSGVIKIPGEYAGKKVDLISVVLSSDTGAYVDYASVVHIRTNEWENPQCARHQARGKSLLAVGDYAGAREELKDALVLTRTPEEKERVLLLLSEVEKVYRIKETERKTGEIFKVADAYRKEGMHEKARAEYEKMKGLSENDFLAEVALFNIAELYREEKDYGNVHRTYREIFSLPGLTPYYRIYGLFLQAETYLEQRNYKRARRLYSSILKNGKALEQHRFKARLYSADTYRAARFYRRARRLYEDILRDEELSEFPHEGRRAEVRDRLDALEGLADGQEEKSRREKRVEWVNRPRYGMYVSPGGSDSNPGTRDKPFATIKRAQEEVRGIKKEEGMPEGGIAVYLREGRYFITESVVFEEEDSGTGDSPVVYRSYPGEDVRIIGGRQVSGFKLVDDPRLLGRLPKESRGRVWSADLKAQGIADYGQLRTRGAHHTDIQPGAMELFYNSRPMQLARWPRKGWLRAGMVEPEGDGKMLGEFYQKGRFRYSEEGLEGRPERWAEEKDIWIAGFIYVNSTKTHNRVSSIDTENRIVHVAKDTRWRPGYPLYDAPVKKNGPYYFFNLFPEISLPGDYYIDRENGILYFYPPEGFEKGEAIVSTLDAPVVEMRQVSNLVLFGLTLEATWRNILVIEGGSNNLVAGSILRNTPNMAVIINEGWNHGIVGCDIYDTGSGGMRITGEKKLARPPLHDRRVYAGGNWKKLIPAGHYAENNHVYRFNRLIAGGNKYGIVPSGVGIRVAHNLMHDAIDRAIWFDGNNHVIEYNEIYDVASECSDTGVIGIYGEPRFLMNRGNVIRYNFLHHISHRFSPDGPLAMHTGIYIDALNGGMTVEGNVFYRHTERAVFTHGPYSRIENNFFIDNREGLTLGNRSWLMDRTRMGSIIPRSEVLLRQVRYKQPPWASRYPGLAGLLEGSLPLGRTENNVIERNVNSGGPFMRVASGTDVGSSLIRNNWDEGNPFFSDRGRMDFRLRPGSPVYGIAGVEPLPFERAGLYHDPLRASWPPERAPAGKYF